MFGLAICCVTVAVMIGSGYVMRRKGYKGSRAVCAVSLGASMFFVLTGAVLSLTSHPAFAEAAAAPVASTGLGLSFLAAAFSTGLACLGAGVAVASVGAAALGLVGEKPEMLGTTLIYLGLAEGIAIYGIIISLFIIGRV